MDAEAALEPRLTNLRDLLRALDLDLENLPDLQITGVVRDSRKVRGGELYCLLGDDPDARARHLAEARRHGAVAVAAAGELATDLPRLQLARPRADSARLIAACHGFPARALDLVGITGTNGKTTTSMMVESILAASGRPFGLVGTVRTRTGRRDLASSMTTPDPEEMQALLAEMRDAGLAGAALEISSHALDQERCAGLELAVAAFSRMTRDHLDYHGDVAAYHAAKLKLLDLLRPGGVVVVNADAPEWERIVAAHPRGSRVLSYALRAQADLVGRILDMKLDGMELEVREGDEVARGRLALIGAWNAENALAAVAAARGLGLGLAEAVAGLEAVRRVPGRLEHRRVEDLDLVIDYAHSPDAFERVMATLRGLARHRLVVVFGCGGDRDRGKRPEMGRIAELLAHKVILTDDNPRSENPAAIVMQIRAGMKEGDRALYVADRREAILCALDEAEPGDLVLLAGKGHEDYQIIGDRRLHHEDAQVVTDWLDWRAGRRSQAP
ncbi:MAG: UDP-N-acetylmuramoyl-L-alanyl-D-glutamate--2,6-diaminopimelate ligase [Planctomycetes bacterium]|nr:UDP-N-acetylmuramoyl-L-alanyl-D-glutamate--2,6-diaminopimelate ligase [Planctomycetota bacterium]